MRGLILPVAILWKIDGPKKSARFSILSHASSVLIVLMVDLPDTSVDLSDTMVEFPDTMVDLPDKMVDHGRTW